MKNRTIGTILTTIGLLILSIVVGILYFMNAIAIWISDTLGTSGDAGIGIQIIIALVTLFVLFSTLVAGLVLLIFGIAILSGVEPNTVMDKIASKIFGRGW